MSGQGRAIAYIRISVVGNRAARGRFESPDLQRDAISAWAAARGVRVVDEIQDLNRSGGTLTRPGLQRALAMLDAGEADGIIVARSDRASRKTLDGLALIDRLDEAGHWIAATDGTIDTTNANGRMITTVFLANAERELSRFREQSAEIHRRAIVEKGRHMGPAPFGYERDPEGRLRIDAARAPWARHVFERRAEGVGWVALSRELADAGVRQANGRRLNPHLLRRMVARRVYVGEAAHGVHVHAAAHPAVVTEGLFAAANRAAPTVRSSPRVDRVHEESVLRGLVRCSGCRYVLKRQPQRSGLSRWVCRSTLTERSATHECVAPARVSGLDGVEVERFVVERFFEIASGTAAPVDDRETGEEAGRRLSEAEALLDELSSLEVRRQLGAARWGQMVADARESVQQAQRDVAHAAARDRRSPTGPVESLAAAWEGMTTLERQEALGSIVQAVMVDAGDSPIAGRTHVIPVWEPVELPRRGDAFVARRWPG